MSNITQPAQYAVFTNHCALFNRWLYCIRMETLDQNWIM